MNYDEKETNQENNHFEESDSETLTDAKVSTENNAKDIIVSELYPLVPLRNMIINPQLVISLFVGRKNSINVIKENENQSIFFVLQKDPTVEKPKP